MKKFVALLAVTCGHQVSEACASVARTGPVTFTYQRNIIIWDKKHGMEHIVRDAAFTTTADDLAFLAPTPSVPQIKIVGKELFGFLDELRKPHEPHYISVNNGTMAVATLAAEPRIIKEENVGMYRAVTLKASDTEGLVEWFRANNYPSGPGRGSRNGRTSMYARIGI